jgi:hypothetical protein
MEDEQEARLEDLPLVEIQEILAESGIELEEHKIAEIAHFVAEVGGLGEALEILAQLNGQEEAA